MPVEEGGHMDRPRDAFERWLAAGSDAHDWQPAEALTGAERTELERLRRELRVLQEENELLRRAAAGRSGTAVPQG
jgi:transposase-like protein